MQVIDLINGSALFAQSAYSASIATKDNLGRDITATYLTGVSIPESATWNDVSTTVQTNSAQWEQGGGGGDEEVNSFVYNNSATINEVNTSYQTNSGTFLTAVDLSPYYTTADANTLSSMLSGAIDYVSANAGDDFPASADEAIQAYQTNSSTYLTSHQDISYLMPKSESANFYPMTGNPSGFINELPDTEDVEFEEINLSSFATSSQISALSAVLTGMIDGKQDTLTFGYDEQDRINSINNSALAGGGDVPTGTMNVSGLEYNAVNEISGYNGSAIAQYGAEKQWLVHDDTLVHAANSAQYALGVNVSALQRLMGIDETVLYENSAGFTTAASGMPLSEKADNFNKLKIVHFWNGNGNWASYGETIVPITNNRITLSHISDISTASGSTYHVTNSIAFESTAHDKFIHMGGWRASFINNGNTSTSDITRITKIIGIGRKQS